MNGSSSLEDTGTTTAVDASPPDDQQVLDGNEKLSALENDCSSSALESMDSCVGCVEGVELQHDFEKSMGTAELIESSIATTHQELSALEASLIRSQIEQKRNAQALNLASLNELDLLNICCSKDGTERVAAGPPSTTTSESGDEQALNQEIVQKTLSSGSGEETLQCAICFDEASSTSIKFAKLPCCGQADETSSIKICTACVLVLSNPTSDGTARVGRCPRCRSWIVVRTPSSTENSDLEISAVSNAGTCKICMQAKEHLVENASVCDACFLGRRYPLLYECDNCHVTQRIPHPMYRYQSSPEEFGNVTWACQGQCRKFSHWRIRPDQVELIPIGDAPELWDNNYLEAARLRVILARNQLSGGSANGCSIL
jgi:hypothetical protein